MKKIFCLTIMLLAIFQTLVFAGNVDNKESLIKHWDWKRMNPVCIYAEKQADIFISGMDYRNNLEQQFGKANVEVPNMKFWGNDEFFIVRRKDTQYSGHINGVGSTTAVKTEQSVKWKTPAGVYVGMPYTEAQKIYGLPEDYAKETFCVVSPDHTKYLMIYRHFESDADGIYRVGGIEVYGRIIPIISNSLKRRYNK